MGVETEIKFRMPKRNLGSSSRLKVPGCKIGERSESDLQSTYFDTRKHKLKRRGLLLRVRQTDGKHVQTIKKTSGTQFGRGEWETEIPGRTPDLDEADGTPLERLASKKLRRKLKPVFETSVHRITMPVRTKRSELELAIDRGRIVAAEHTSRIEEVELELKSGAAKDLFRVAKVLERKLAAELCLRGKADEGYDLVNGRHAQAVFAEPIELGKRMTAIEGFQAIARSALRHFSGNVEAIRKLDPEGVHQMRVGLRRLRAAISLFSKVLPDAKTEEIKTELRWLTSELAPARELDVFLEEKIGPVAREIISQRGGKAIAREFADKRAAARERASKAVNSPRCRALLVDVLQWIETQHGRTDAANSELGEFGAKLLDRRMRKADKDAEKLPEMTATERHKFRIRMKKLRYAAEFFESLFRSKPRRKALAHLSKHAKKIQDALGSLNDFIADRKMAADAALHAPPQDRRARAFASGIIVGREDEQAKPLMKAAAKELRALRHLSGLC
ncbi:CHAD domain-containing protein [Bradyrhizobium sp. 200]|uniref:CYTH and CHAD domain-containing protein n=1 Tax=Bradyrhizobium sp. 200 TaxID=2782665 RepID=UPI001FFFEA5A|nr:CHAD domain-containing protein [Bradyrhizobium sp. 200]UPJ51621.1 CHAD domain-containing protein [Bradyrhizobium sp. 200]